jgi:drug/metabolite transporter (DMT)-like permease
MTAQGRTIGYALAAAGAALFSTKAIFIKLAYMDDVNATLMLAYRMIFALPFFVAAGIWAYRAKRARKEPMPSRRTIVLALATGFIGYYMSALLDFKGLEYISAQLERLVLFTYPLFVMFLGRIFFGMKLTKAGLAAAAVSYLGLAIVFGVDLPVGGISTVIGTSFVLGCAVTFALYQLFAKGFITAMGSVLFTSLSLSASAAICMLHHIAVKGFNFAATPRFIWLAAGCAVFATVMPSFLMNAGMARTSPQATAMISTISPLVTIALAVWILGEPFTAADALGSTMVLAGVGLYTWSDMARKKNPLPQEDV